MKMSSNTVISVLLVGVLMGLVASSQAYDFYVGSRDGWVSNPSESYSTWAGRNRFQINDTLVFKYKSGADSVLVVTKQAYDTCNLSDPIQKLEGGNSAFRFDRSGPFYFVSGVAANCQKGQKLMVVVLADRSNKRSQSSPSPSSLAPISPSPAPAVQAGSPTLSPSSATPALAPTSSPAGSPSPSSLAPISPSPAPAGQAGSPSLSPSSVTPALAPSRSPAGSPSSISPPASPSSTSPISPSPSSYILPAPQNSPPSSATAVSPPSPSPPSPSSAFPRVTAPTVTLELVAMILGGALLY